MACGSCGTGKPNGCKSNGGCSTGGCNRMNTHDWLHNLPIADADDVCRVIEVSFNQGSRKDFYRNTTLHIFEKGELIALEGVGGFDVGEVSLTGEIVRLQMKKRNVSEKSADMKKVLRRATDRDIDIWKSTKTREAEALVRTRAIAKQLNLNMKMSSVEFQADGKKGTFYYIADDRVDFREMIKIFASEFKVKVEMRQIGARQESGKVGGIGACGRELCCATWLTDFKSVNTAAARYQNLSINQTKLSGQCGRLKCCLNYELDTYLDALQGFPDNADMLQVAKGPATLVKKDIFKNLMWYVLPQSNKQYPLTIERVQKIKGLNRQNIVPEELEAVEVVSQKPKEVEPEFVDVVGQISLRSLERADRKKRDRAREQRGSRQQGGSPNVGGNRLEGQGRNRPNPSQKAEGGRPPQKTEGEQQRQPQQKGPRPEGGAARPPRQQGDKQRPPQAASQRSPGGQPSKEGPIQKPNPTTGDQQPRPLKPQLQRKPNDGNAASSDGPKE